LSEVESFLNVRSFESNPVYRKVDGRFPRSLKKDAEVTGKPSTTLGDIV